MAEENNIPDDIFRNALKDYKEEPSDKLWGNIEKNIPGRTVGTGLLRKYYQAAAILFILISVVVTTYYYTGNRKLETRNLKHESQKQKSISEQQTTDSEHQIVNSEKQGEKILHGATQNSIQRDAQSTEKSIANNEHQTTKNEQKIVNSEKITTINEELIAKNEEKTTNKEQIITKNEEQTTNNKQLMTKSEEPLAKSEQQSTKSDVQKMKSEEKTTMTFNTSVINTSEPSQINPDDNLINPEQNLISELMNYLIPRKDSLLVAHQLNIQKELAAANSPVLKQSISDSINKLIAEGQKLPVIKPDVIIGLNYTAEYFISKSPLFSKKDDFANSNDISLTLGFKDFQVRSGLGISFYNKDNWNYTVNYNKKEAIGNYTKVDSVAFNVFSDTINHTQTVKPKFYTQEQTVYDNVNHLYKSELNKTYTYIQFPLVIGYKVGVNNNFTFSLNAGTVFSVLIASKGGTVIYPENANEIIYIENSELRRVRTYWNYLISLGINYKIDDRVSINIEPTYKSVLGSVYENNNTQIKKPYSVGLRMGLLFKL